MQKPYVRTTQKYAGLDLTVPQNEEFITGETKKAITDDQLKKMMAENKPSFFLKHKFHIVTLALIALNVIVYLIEVYNSGLKVSITNQVLVDMGAMYTPYVRSAADLYRFITPMFLHVDLMHIAFNMVALYSVGGMLEHVLGKRNFLLLYFIGGITGNVISYLADVYISTTITISAGASTSVFALFVAAALLGVLHKGNNRYFAQFSKGMLSIIAINIFYTFLVPSISISGHLGGAFGGLIAMFMIPSKNLKVSTAVRILVAAAWVGALVYFVFHERFFIF